MIESKKALCFLRWGSVNKANNNVWVLTHGKSNISKILTLSIERIFVVG